MSESQSTRKKSPQAASAEVQELRVQIEALRTEVQELRNKLEMLVSAHITEPELEGQEPPLEKPEAPTPTSEDAGDQEDGKDAVTGELPVSLPARRAGLQLYQAQEPEPIILMSAAQRQEVKA